MICIFIDQTKMAVLNFIESYLGCKNTTNPI